jgi:MYXO-CTERM domain-containing protein
MGCSHSADLEVERYEDRPRALLKQPLVWGGEQKLVAADAAELDEFGRSVSLTAERAIVGAYAEDDYTGAAYVFVKNGSSWVQEQKLVASDAAHAANFGWSVSIAEGRALVGAYGDDGYRGAAYVFARDGSLWVEEQKLVAGEAAEFDQLGWSVSLAADRALVGAYGANAARGAAHVFVRSGTTWVEEQKLVPNAEDEANFGYSVSLFGDSALVGAPGEDSYRGKAYVFRRSDGAWLEERALAASDGSESDQLGNSVSLAADRALVGAFWDDDFRGAAYVFVRSGNAWSEEQKLLSADGAVADRFGNSVSLSADRALVGAVGNDVGRGAAYVFARTASSWSQEHQLVASDGGPEDLFAWSVALSGNHAIVGANYVDQLRGAAYVSTLGLANGDACSAHTDCASGHCSDERCCDIDCGGACGACSADAGAAVDGTCSVFPAGFEGSPACGALTCNGRSPECAACEADEECPGESYCAMDRTCRSRAVEGEPETCARSDDCASGYCEDGVCCDRSCAANERCRAALKLSGDDGTCGPAKAAAPGEPCAFDVQCTSEHCASGTCTDAQETTAGDSGCGCRVERSGGTGPHAWVGVAVGGLLWRRRRRTAG